MQSNLKSTGSEEWRAVVGYEGLYQVSDRGRVKSLERTAPARSGSVRKVSERVLRQFTDDVGRKQVSLTREGKTRAKRVHRLVAEAFLTNPGDLPLVLHGDGDPGNNCVSNLRWGTHSQNRLDAVRHGTHPFASREECVKGHLLRLPNLTPGGVKKGYRACKACSWERACAQRTNTPYTQERADTFYKRIMEE